MNEGKTKATIDQCNLWHNGKRHEKWKRDQKIMVNLQGISEQQRKEGATTKALKNMVEGRKRIVVF